VLKPPPPPPPHRRFFDVANLHRLGQIVAIDHVLKGAALPPTALGIAVASRPRIGFSSLIALRSTRVAESDWVKPSPSNPSRVRKWAK
jgi:hypothetical protein